MQLNILEHADQAGLEAARACEAILRDTIAEKEKRASSCQRARRSLSFCRNS